MPYPNFVRNVWYLAAWSHEVPVGGMLSRTLLGERWVLFRRSDGPWSMLADRCPHRFVPLSRGRRIGDTIQCGYHGLTFNGAGECVRNLFSEQVPGDARVRSLPIVERHRGLWFWPGDPELADVSTIPDFAFLDESGDEFGVLRMEANYELFADNLMDLSHVELLHVESFGTNGSLFSHGKQTVKTLDDGSICNHWDITGATPPGWAQPMLPEGARIDQWIHMRWHAPACMALSIGISKAGSEHRDLVVPAMLNPHILTPESHVSTHYFYTHEPTAEARAMAMRVFVDEDEPMVRAAHEAMGDEDFWSLRPLILPSDAGAIRARRRLKSLRAAEAGGTSQDTSPAMHQAGGAGGAADLAHTDGR